MHTGTGFSLGSLSGNSIQTPTDPSVARNTRLATLDRGNNNKSSTHKPSWGDNEIGILKEMGFDGSKAKQALDSCNVSSKVVEVCLMFFFFRNR